MKIKEKIKDWLIGKDIIVPEIKAVESPVGYEPAIIDGFKSDRIDRRQFLKEIKGWSFANINAIAENIAQIQLKLFQESGDGFKEVAKGDILNSLNKVNDYTTKFDHFWLTAVYLEAVGEAPWFLDKDKEGKVVGIYVIDPSKLKPIPDESNNRIVGAYEFDLGMGKKETIPADQIVPLKIPDPANPVRGIGTMYAGARTIDIDNAAEKWNFQFFKNNASPGAIVKIDTPNLTREQREKIKRRIEEQYKGVEKSQQLWVLFNDMSVEPFGMSLKDMDFNEQQKWTADKIRGIFRVPKVILAQTEGVNLASAKAGEQVFIQNTIKPKMERIVQQLNEFFLPQFAGTEKMFLDFVDPATQARELVLQEYDNGLKNGWLTINEVRAEENRPSIGKVGDMIYLPINLIGKETKISTKSIPQISYDRKQQLNSRTKPLIDKDNIKTYLSGEIKKMLVNSRKEVKPEVKKEVKKVETKQFTQEQKDGFWKIKAAIYDKYLPVIRKEMDDIFTRQEKETLKKLNGQKEIKVDVSKVLLDKKSEAKKFIQVFTPIMTLLMEDSGAETFAFLGVDQALDVSGKEIQNYIKSRTTHFSISSSDTTNDKIKATLGEGLQLGESQNQLSTRIANVFGSARDYRSDAIARSEDSRFNVEATERAYIESGVVESKEWIINPGACPICIPFNGKQVSLGTTFADKGDETTTSDGGKYMVTYEDVQHPPLHPNCFIDHNIPIFTSKGWKKIGDISVNDLVLTHKNRFRKVTKLIRTPKQLPEVSTIEFEFTEKRGGKKKHMCEELTLTSNHPVLVNGKWIDAGKINIGDKLKILSNYCITCGKLIPWFKQTCNHTCQSRFVTKRQWASKEHRLNISKKVSESMKMQWLLGTRDYKQLEDARKNNKSDFFGSPECIKMAHIALGKKNYGQSYLEKKVRWILEKNNIELTPQFPIKRNYKDTLGRARYYFADFIIKDTNILIECDGDEFHKDKEKDERRQKEIEGNGFQVLRFSEETIKKNLMNVLLEVNRVMANHNGEYKTINVEVKGVRKWTPKKPKMLYNFSVEEDESYIAKGFVVHNCRCDIIAVLRPEKSVLTQAEKDVIYLKKKIIQDKEVFINETESNKKEHDCNVDHKLKENKEDIKNEIIDEILEDE